MATTYNPCCNLHFTCVACPIITGPDCVPPNNLMPGQLWYNPCTCTYYFDNPNCPDSADECSGYEALNHKAGAGILYSGGCEEGSYISVHIDAESGLGFTETGALTIDCSALIEHCALWYAGNCEEMVAHCQLFTRNNLVPGEGHFYLECEEDPESGQDICTFYIDTIIQARDAGEVSSAGVCVAILGLGYSNNAAIWQARTNTFIRGSGTGLNIGGVLSETFSNPWNDSAYIEVDLIAQDNVAATLAGVAVTGPTVTFIHSITETLNVTPPNFGAFNSPVPSNWLYNQITASNRFFQPTPEASAALGVYSPQTAACKYSKILAPGESVTLYYQWWAVFDSAFAAVQDTYTLHGGAATASKMIRHAAHF